MIQDGKYISMLGPLHPKCKRCGERNRKEDAAHITKSFGKYWIHVRVCMSVCGKCQRKLAQKIFEAAVKEHEEWDK